MELSQTKTNIRWSIFVFSFLFLFSSALYVAADDVVTDELVFSDADGDGLSNDEEKIYGTDPEVADTDGDSYSDGVEIKGGFDPLKPAPGDRIVAEEVRPEDSPTVSEGTVNLTEVAAQEFSELIDKKIESGESAEITSADLETAMADVMAQSETDIVLPEVNTDNLQVKLLDPELSEEEKKDQSREDAIEYLTLVSYILISNAPVQIRDTSSLQGFLMDSGNKMIAGMVSGNYDFLDAIEERGQKALDEVNKVVVPESMITIHVKALQIMTFAANLKEVVKASVSPADPIGQMYMFSKVQGFLMSFDSFIEETQSYLMALGIENIPLEI